MAVFDLTIIEKLGALFPFLLVLVLVYGFLQYAKPFGKDKQAVYGVIAFVLAILTILSDTTVTIINMMAPWFILMFIVAFFLIMAFMFFGVKEKDIAHVFKTDKAVIYWMIFFVALIFVLALGKVIGPDLLSYSEGSADVVEGQEFQANIFSTIFHPKVLGMVIVFVVALFTVKLLSSQDRV